jgi:hypothetical protein
LMFDSICSPKCGWKEPAVAIVTKSIASTFPYSALAETNAVSLEVANEQSVWAGSDSRDAKFQGGTRVTRCLQSKRRTSAQVSRFCTGSVLASQTEALPPNGA